MILQADRVVTPEAVLTPGRLRTEGDTIAEVGRALDPAARGVVAFPGRVLVPGYVDMHVHGGGGASFTTGRPGDARVVLDTHLRRGTTSMVASLVTDEVEAMAAAVRSLAPLVAGGDLLGVHLEGPWLSPNRAGAHAGRLLRAPTAVDADRLLDDAGTVVMVTLAPELPGSLDILPRLVGRGVRVAVGHTDATYAEVAAAIAAGARVATHLFNAMRPLHHREPGPVLALLEADGVTVEVVADGVHVHPALVAALLRNCPGRVALVTDATSAAGCPDGDHALGPLTVQVVGGVARVASTGALAGSTICLADAVRVCVRDGGVPLPSAVRAASSVPAAALGRADVGRLAPGARADVLVLREDAHVEAVMRAGTWTTPP